MNKLMLIISILFAAHISFAVDACLDDNGNDITNDPALFTELISKKATCYEATEMARACAWGSSLDVQTVATAYAICETEMTANKATAEDQKLLATMEARCFDRYANEDGTLYRAIEAHCRLTAIEWLTGVIAIEQ